MRDFEGCLNPAKSHLWGLPTLNKETPNYPGESKRGLVIFPIFLTRPGDTSIEHHIVKSAAWARRSWIIFSDAEALDIGMKFYVELQVKDRVLSLLRENGMNTERDVLYFDGRDMEGEPQTHLGKKLSMFSDNQFKDYDWVWQMDVDMFLASPTRKKYPFFERVIEHEKEIGASEVWELKKGIVLQDMHWWNYLLDANDETKTQEWLRRAAMLIDPKEVDKYLEPFTGRMSIGGGIYAFPAKTFLANRESDCEWIVRAGKIMQDDESVFSLWCAKGEKLFDIANYLQIEFDPRAEWVAKRYHHTDHFLNHVGRMDYEYLWRKSFDSL